MSSQQSESLAASDITDSEVEHYLSNHPDFFTRHPGLLAGLRLPHDAGAGSVSLVERQLSVIRQKNRKLESRLRELVEVAHANHDLSERVHRLALALMSADSRDAVVHTLEHSLREDFEAADSVVILFHGPADIVQRQDSRFLRLVDRTSAALQPFATFLEQTKTRCGRARDTQLEFLFPEHAMEIGSVALVPLGEGAELGMLAVGSTDAERFHPGMSTDILDRLGQLFSAALAARTA